MGTAAVEDRFAELLAGGGLDPNPVYAEARRDAPIFWSEATSGWVVTRRDDVARVLEDEEHFAPLGSGAGSSMIHGRVILHMEGTEHRRKSALLARRIRSPKRIQGQLTELVQGLCARYLEAIEPGEPIDLKQAYTTALPLQVTADLMGIPEAPRFRAWYDAIVAAGASNLRGDPEVQRRGTEARAALFEFLRPVIADRREHPGDDLLSDLCTFEYEGEALPDAEILASCSFLLAAGVETTDRALSSLYKQLIHDHDSWDRLASDRSLIPSACAEILRFSPPVHGVSRGMQQATELSGQEVLPGEKVFAAIASANRDEDYFDRSEEFVLDRFVDNPQREFTPRSTILPFGAGRHHCQGSLLAKMEMEEATNALFDRFASAEFVDGLPPDTGYVLRSPAHLRVRLMSAPR